MQLKVIQKNYYPKVEFSMNILVDETMISYNEYLGEISGADLLIAEKLRNEFIQEVMEMINSFGESLE